MKKIALILILGFIVVTIALNFGPVWIQQLVGYYMNVEKIAYPVWINDEEYCYVKVKNSYDYQSISFAGDNKGFNVWLIFRGPMATFYIYKVNINEPGKEKLIKKLTMKVGFQIPEPEVKIDRNNFIFKSLDNGNLALAVKGRSANFIYFFDSNGKSIKKITFNKRDEFKEPGFIDISSDGKKLLMSGDNLREGVFIKDATFGKSNLLFEDSNEKSKMPIKWLDENLIVVYSYSYLLGKKDNFHKANCEIFLINGNNKNEMQLVNSFILQHINKFRYLALDIAFAPKENILFLSNIGIFKKKENSWEIIKDLKDWKFDYFYPDFSPNGKKIIGVENKLKGGYWNLDSSTAENRVDLEDALSIKIFNLEDLVK